MNQQQYKYQRLVLLAVDFIVIIGLFLWFLFLNNRELFWGYNPLRIIVFLIKYQIKSLLFLTVAWFLIAQYLNFYRYSRFQRFLDYIRKSFFQLLLFGFVLFALSGIKNQDLFANRESALFILVLALYVLSSRALIFFWNKRERSRGKHTKNIAIIGYNLGVRDLVEMIDRRKDLGLKIVKHYVTGNPESNQEIFSKEKLQKALEEKKIDVLYICLGNELAEETTNEVSAMAEENYLTVGFIPSNYIYPLQSLEVSYLDAFPILTHKNLPLDQPFNQIVKRIFDLLFTLILFVVVLWWAIPLISLLVFFSQGRPIFFAQKRNGLNGKEFNCYKFRTMRPDKDNNKKPTERDDPRVTKLGRILRKTSLDELPQFFNVLKGDMSIVGPRPHMISENESYSEIIRRYSLRHYVKPGITGLAQIKGYRGAIDDTRDMELRVRTDIYYVRNWSFLLDLFIIYKTFMLMLKGDDNAI